jgi:ribosomal protein L6P/L9E
LSFSKIYFKKLKFRGKGYYIYKNYRNTVAPQFGYSHMNRIFGYQISLKFITKTIIFIYGINIFDILKMGRAIFSKRPQNIFTGKGVRFSRQIIYKKTGKISSYR